MLEEIGTLGFSYSVRKNGEVELSRHGRLATLLKGKAALAFVAKVSLASAAEAQQLMARATGNYKRGNERQAAGAQRNAAPGSRTPSIHRQADSLKTRP